MARERREFRWRIAVGGIRGKSSVTRLIAAAMREAGIRVAARTTGSRPVVIYPDGHEEEISRPAAADILEGKRFLQQARQVRAEAIVVELMAIKPECLEAEVRQIFRPHYLVLTNFRPDHVEELGQSREEVARNILRAIRPDLKGTTVFLLEEEISSEMKQELASQGARVVVVAGPKDLETNSGQKKTPEDMNLEKKNLEKKEDLEREEKLEKKEDLKKKDLSKKKVCLEAENNRIENDYLEAASLKIGEWSLGQLRLTYGDDFASNIRLALAVTRCLGLKEEEAVAGMKKARPDFGSLKIWEIMVPGKTAGYAVSAFAANDPESSSLVIAKLRASLSFEGKKIYGLLLLRRDRGDRTRQWLQAIESGFLADFDGLFLSGCPYFPFLRVLRKIRKITKKKNKGLKSFFGLNIKRINRKQAKGLIDWLSQTETTPWILLGLGNIVGLGGELVALWDRTGRRIHG